jgi:hypothetical protein
MALRSIAVLITAVAGLAVAAVPQTPDPAAPEGLVKVKSASLDELYLRPHGEIAGYRRILVDPPRAELRQGWLKYMNGTRDVTRWLVPDDARRITDEAADAMGSAVKQAFIASGYETVTEPGPGVLRLSPSVADLFVNAPDVPAPGIQAGIVRHEAGTATLVLEARDAVTGTLLGRVVDRESAQEVQRFSRATSVSNTFWFEAMFRQWASNCAKEFVAAKSVP